MQAPAQPPTNLLPVTRWPKAEGGSAETMKQARDLNEGMVRGIFEAQGVRIR
jgi:hypothetical protein